MDKGRTDEHDGQRMSVRMSQQGRRNVQKTITRGNGGQQRPRRDAQNGGCSSAICKERNGNEVAEEQNSNARRQTDSMS